MLLILWYIPAVQTIDTIHLFGDDNAIICIAIIIIIAGAIGLGYDYWW